MKLFKIVNYQLQVEDEVWTIEAFNKLLKRDKTKDKSVSMKEMAFIYHYCDVRSDYVAETNKNTRAKTIKKDIGLPEKWEIDDVIKFACELYEERAVTVSEKLYKASLKSARDVAKHLSNTSFLLAERDEKGKPVHTINSITAANKMIPDMIKNLNQTYKEVIKEQNDLADKKKGAKQFGMFEDGFILD